MDSRNIFNSETRRQITYYKAVQQELSETLMAIDRAAEEFLLAEDLYLEPKLRILEAIASAYGALYVQSVDSGDLTQTQVFLKVKDVVDGYFDQINPGGASGHMLQQELPRITENACGKYKPDANWKQPNTGPQAEKKSAPEGWDPAWGEPPPELLQ